MKAALLCLICWHWTLSHRHASEEELDKLKEFYCEECRATKRILYKGLVEPLPAIETKPK
jgi:hypothetical protein